MIKEKLKRGSIFYKLYLYFNIFIRYKILKRHLKTYSQFGEDLFIDDFFQNQKEGKYVDLGAFHPMRLSNTFLLHKKGWSGTNIDFNPISRRLLALAKLGAVPEPFKDLISLEPAGENRTKQSPPIPVICGSHIPRSTAPAIAASIAFPPSFKISNAA